MNAGGGGCGGCSWWNFRSIVDVTNVIVSSSGQLRQDNEGRDQAEELLNCKKLIINN